MTLFGSFFNRYVDKAQALDLIQNVVGKPIGNISDGGDLLLAAALTQAFQKIEVLENKLYHVEVEVRRLRERS